MEMDSPWGKLEADAGDRLAVVRYAIKQLEYYLKKGNGDPCYLKRDIEGYKELLGTNNNDLIEKFFDLKQEYLAKNKKPENRDLIKDLKIRGDWEVRH